MIKNREGYRVCIVCKIEKELTSVNFYSEKSRKLGFSYRCRMCDSLRKDYRRNRYIKLSEIQKERKKQRTREYTSYGLGRATSLICAYKKIDRKINQICDLDRDFMVDNIFNKSCVYCGSTEKLGCDRIDNSLGHTKNNVVPCCRVCNVTRMDNFSHSEMLLIGEVIKKIKLMRLNPNP